MSRLEIILIEFKLSLAFNALDSEEFHVRPRASQAAGITPEPEFYAASVGQ